MEELKPDELEELVQELESESGEEETLSPEVEELLRDLQSGSSALDRMDAAQQLGEVGTSNPRIVRGLIAVYESDSYSMVSRAAAKALRAPVHQECLQQDPELAESAKKALAKVRIPDTGSKRTSLMDADTLIERYNSGERSFRHISLREADLRGADLSGSDLRGSNLYGADLREANLARVDLRSANLYGADLRKANLCEADLRDASLYGAELGGARLGEANLSGADLTGAELHGADLRSTDLTGAFLQGTGVAQEQLAQAASVEDMTAQGSWALELWREIATPSRRRKPVSNFHIGLMISAGVILLGISIAGLQADMPAGMPRTWQAKELMIYVQLLSLLCLLPGVVLSGWALWNWLAPWGARNVFRRSMKETSAVVCRAWRDEQTNEWGGHTGYKYWVTISLQAADVHGDSRDIPLKLRVKRPIWESLEADMTVTARYAAENPRIALIQGEW